jgi:hypothetical protein
MTRHRAEAKERGTVESGVVNLRVHVPPLLLILSESTKSVLQYGAQEACCHG